MFLSIYLLVTICGYVVGLCCTCNMNINLNESITTVNLLDYSLQSKCIWRLEADRNASIVVKGVFVRLTGSLDRVVALDGSSVNGSVIKQCDFGCTLKDFLMVSSGNTMLLIIELDENPGKRIVEVQAWAQKNGGRYYNDGNINLKNGAKGAKSYFQLHSTDQNQQVQVLLQESTSFSPGSIAIYDGYSETDDILVTFRNDANFNVPITSSKQDLLVVATDQKYLFGKFLSVQPGCHKVSSGQSGDFILDRKNFISECDWLINPSLYAGNIMFEIRSVDLCDNETLEIYEGLSTYGQRLATVAKSTGAINFLKFTTAAGKGMSVFLNTDAGCTTDIPFSGSYWIVPDCTADLQTSGTITSPQYPSQYPLNAMCTWLAPTKNITTSFYITFNNLNLAIGHNITVTNAVTVVMNYTGSDLPSDLLVQVENDTTTSIDFYSYSENAGTGIEIPGQGFNLSYRVLDCGESLISDRGIIDSNTSIPADAEECVWIVTVPPKSGKSVNIISFTIDIIGKANWQNLELRDGGSVRSPLLHQGDKPLAKFMSFMTRYNELWIHYRRNQNGSSGDLADEKFSFYLSFSTYSCDKNHLCQNGICLHPEWRCNGVNDCGDNTDELRCADSNTGVKVWIVVVIGVVCFLLGVVIAIAANMTYNRWRHRNYSKLESTNDPALR